MKKIDLKDMTDVCGGKMALSELIRELCHYMEKKPSHLVVNVRRVSMDEYHATIYMTNEDFKRTC